MEVHVTGQFLVTSGGQRGPGPKRQLPLLTFTTTTSSVQFSSMRFPMLQLAMLYQVRELRRPNFKI